MRWLAALTPLVLLAAIVAPASAAWACPACAGNDDGGLAYLGVMGGMILLPFGIVAVVVRILRGAEADQPSVVRSAGQTTAWLLAAATAVYAPAASAAVRPEDGFGMPRDVSVDGWRMDWLIHVTLVFVTILFVIMCVWIVLAVVKHNTKHEAVYDHGSAKKQVTRALFLSGLIFFVVDGNLFYTSMVDLDEAYWNYDKAEADPNAVRIEINAHQWAWDARYAGPDGKFNTPDDIVTLNDIRIPTGAAIIVQIASTDVLHSFYLPNLRVKTDAVPGMINRFWFQARDDGVGEYDIACAQHCGVHHYKMKGKLTILSPADYAVWAARASSLRELAFDAEDEEAQWGWPWKENF